MRSCMEYSSCVFSYEITFIANNTTLVKDNEGDGQSFRVLYIILTCKYKQTLLSTTFKINSVTLEFYWNELRWCTVHIYSKQWQLDNGDFVIT